MIRQLVISFSFLLFSAATLACQRQQALIRPSAPYLYEPAVVAQPLKENAYTVTPEIKDISQAGEPVNELVAHNTGQRVQSPMLHKRVVRMEKNVKITKRLSTLIALIYPMKAVEQAFTTRNARREMNYTPRLSVSDIGGLFALGGVAMMLLGLKFNSFSLLIIGFLVFGTAIIVATIARFTGR